MPCVLWDLACWEDEHLLITLRQELLYGDCDARPFALVQIPRELLPDVLRRGIKSIEEQDLNRHVQQSLVILLIETENRLEAGQHASSVDLWAPLGRLADSPKELPYQICG